MGPETLLKKIRPAPLACAALVLLASCAGLAPRRGTAPDDPWADEIQRVQASRQQPSSRELYVGMTMGEVRGAWGAPAQAQISGPGDSGNERWIYSRGFIANPVLDPPRRVYFEEGQVVGWDAGP